MSSVFLQFSSLYKKFIRHKELNAVKVLYFVNLVVYVVLFGD